MNQQEMKKVLLEMANRFAAAGIRFALGASGMLYARGLTEVFHDLDIIVALEDAQRAEALLLPLGEEKRPVSDARYATKFFRKFTIQGVEIDMIGGFAVCTQAGVYHYELDEAAIPDGWTLEGTKIPLAALEDWYVLYALMGREEKHRLLKNTLGERGIAHKQLLRRAQTKPIPDALKMEIDELLR